MGPPGASNGSAELALEHDCQRSQLPSALAARFVRLDDDAGLRTWLGDVERRRAGPFKTLAQRVLRGYMSDFDANAVLDIYSMYLLSTPSWQRLLGGRTPGRRLLDVGAGSGDVTVELSPLFDDVVTTELSRGMARRLRRRGFRCVRADLATDPVPDPPYEVISCLNVLDRCPRPLSLLERLRAAVAPGGRLVIAMPLPYAPLFYEGPRTLDPAEPLPCQAATWEGGAAELARRVLIPRGLEIEHLARAPYLSAGDSKAPVYELDDVIAVCKVAFLGA